MLSDPLVIVAALLWLGLLFGAAIWAERRPQLLGAALAVRVQPVAGGVLHLVDLLRHRDPGAALGLADPADLHRHDPAVRLRLRRSCAGCWRSRASRTRPRSPTWSRPGCGKHSGLAAAITFVAVLGIIPYIALQLKAVTMSYGLLTDAAQGSPSPWQDSALYVALAMALFAMLFGTRRASLAEHNRGLVMAMAVESLLKLGAMLALGVFVWTRAGLARRHGARRRPMAPAVSRR